jgi:cyclopropane-fatty-acyl-phospholipid synthase
MTIFDHYLNKSVKKFADNFFTKLNRGKLTVIYPSNFEKVFLGKKKGYEADIRLKNYKLFSKLLRKGATGLAESYMDGDFETKNLSKLLLFGHENESEYLVNHKASSILDYYIKLKHYLNENTKNRSKKNIEYHYDLGNNFYKHWLDQSMTYSSAIFHENNINLFDAQINKYEQIAKPMNLNENSALLEIGCGWGGFSTYVAKKYKSNIKAITISKEQYDFTCKKIFSEGLNEKVSVEMLDYRDVDAKYSNIASIEMFEAVGQKYWGTFLDVIKTCLLPEGIASLQIITINDDKVKEYQKNPDFIQQYIFPGGVLPSKSQLKKISQDIGLSLF